jgi:hypothetical protein
MVARRDRAPTGDGEIVPIRYVRVPHNEVSSRLQTAAVALKATISFSKLAARRQTGPIRVAVGFRLPRW